MESFEAQLTAYVDKDGATQVLATISTENRMPQLPRPWAGAVVTSCESLYETSSWFATR